MAYSNNQITGPVNQYDVQRALGISSPHWNELCTSENINKWARYKPIRTLTKRVNNVTFSIRKGVNWGLDIPFCNTSVSQGWRADMMNKMVWAILERDYTGWEYLRPRGDRTPQGGVEEFFRITDYCRNPNETTPDANGDPTPIGLQGYNHMAAIPFSAFINMAGATEHSDADGVYYEINIQVIQQIMVTFTNSGGDDLHLQDFIDLDASYGNNIAWRPVVQVFCGYIHLNSNDDNDREPWYERDNLGTNDSEMCGGAITSNPQDSWSVSVDLSDPKFTPFVGVNEFFHMCIGVGCVNPDFSSWKSGENALFIIPYTEDQLDNGEYPFYVRFKLVSYQSRRIYVTQLQFFQNQTTWVVASASGYVFTINSNASTLIRLTFTITKEENQSLEFIGEHGTVESASNSPLKIQVREMINYVETIKYLTPQTDTWHTPQHNPVVGTGQTSETATLYADFYMANISVGQYAEYHIYAYTGATEGGNEKYDNIGSFSIFKEQYHN